jgi:hypothetical protein
MRAGNLPHHARHAIDIRTNRGPINSMYPPAMMPETSADPAMTTASPTTGTASDNPHATFLYPTGQPTVNNIDTVQVSYDTIWQHANLTLYCEADGEDTWAMAAINMSMQRMGW